MPHLLRGESFDHVIANLPYFLGGTVAPDAGRGTARHEDTPLSDWIAAGLRRLRPGGTITLIQRADRLDAILSALAGAGAFKFPRFRASGREAGRVILLAHKGAPLCGCIFLFYAKPSHSADAEDLTEAAQAVLRGCGTCARNPGFSVTM